MSNAMKFYIGGRWIGPQADSRTVPVVNPATGEAVEELVLGSEADVDLAVSAARKAFASYSVTPVAERIALIERILAIYNRRAADLAAAVRREMGAPDWLAAGAQVPSGAAHLAEVIRYGRNFAFEERIHEGGMVLKEPIGVCGLITPWNWPLNQVTCKIGPALLAGCTMILKPSQLAPLSALILAEIIDEAGAPPGVFNLVNGDGRRVGDHMARHPDIDMISFTGSTAGGVAVAEAAAGTIKRVAQELGGKSPNIILDDADLAKSVRNGVIQLMVNSGQSCNSPSRLLVPRALHDQAREIAVATANAIKVMTPEDAERGAMGPLANASHFHKVAELIEAGVAEGCDLAAGGGRPEGLEMGFYLRPTIFANMDNDALLSREEIFGPVLVMIPFDDDDDAVRIANDTPYGLAAYVQSGDLDRAKAVARRLRAGSVSLCGAPADFSLPFGGYKRSGNGREWGIFGVEDYLEVKGVAGWK
ncbi:aldehyde dehydrogenase family protein [Sphingobium sp. TKS]|uniref:aldehyde dehydrogenase family protein n=1 Tax=Sphingobium sp. TKS TaxID=1315974 RepID=UPI00077035D3|nr:aldehyde dehydrogenase family protein [Sphingobium sp. TKS]AMK25609.1 NAD-dependent aldehyde dehydrogenase [Sphingobium sp. TKS]